MAKKLRFPLKMENEVEVRSIQELKDNFSLERVMVYISNGKLAIWLRDRYEDDIADDIEKLDLDTTDISKKIYEIFDIEYKEEDLIDLEKSQERSKKLEQLKKYTNEQKFFDVIDHMAFSQDDLYDLLDENKNTIYLCGSKFSIPIAKKGITYIGVNNPIVEVSSKKEVNWIEKDIKLIDIKYDERYQKILDDIEKNKKINCEKEFRNCNRGNYSNKSYLNFLLSLDDKKKVTELYSILSHELRDINYCIDDDIVEIKRELIDEGLVGLGSDYIERL